MTTIVPGIFKAYDIRGIYPAELDEETAFCIGRAIATFSKAKKVFVGRDVRPSSPSIFKSLVKGLTLQGVNVTDIGICSTPMLYFASATLPTELGISVTASHNPKEYTGFKICRQGTVPIGGENGIYEIRDLCLKGNFVLAKKKGTISRFNLLKKYRQFFLKKNKERFPFRVVIDTANSVGLFDAQILQKLCRAVPLFFKLDGNFPNHLGNPLDYETLKALQKKVVEEKADFGISFDGDADRICFIDEKGQRIPSDLTTALLARFFPGETVLYDCRSTKQIETEIKKVNGTPVRCKVGHFFIKEQMRELNAAFAGELSGHYYYRSLFFAESSLQTALLMLQLLQQEKKPFSELVQSVQKFFQSGEINSDVKEKEAKMKELEAYYKKMGAKTSWLDGVTIEFPDWWCNVRSSNTEPLLRLNLEADSKELCKQKTKELLELIRKL